MEKGTYIFRFQTKKSILKEDGKKVGEPTYLLISNKATREELVKFVEDEFLGELDLRTMSFVEHFSDMELTGRETIKTLSLEFF